MMKTVNNVNKTEKSTKNERKSESEAHEFKKKRWKF